MWNLDGSGRLVCVLAPLLAFAAASVGMGPALAQGAIVTLAPHRAIYDLKLGQARGKTSLIGVRGRILYDFGGNACEGYTLQFRQVSELDNGEGRVSTSDLRSTTYEDGDAKNFRFSSQNSVNQRPTEAVDGHAQRGEGATSVSLTKPGRLKFSIDANIVFPTEHMRRAIIAAREGKTILEFPVFDGSESGQKVYNTLTVIGQPIAPDQRKPADAAANKAALSDMRRWPVTISYFDKAASGDAMPAYAISFEMYENGISRALALDYNDFIVNGELTSLEIRDAKPCP